MDTKRRVLITAGATWVPIDKVRVIGNLASGETGILLADEFSSLGASVTLLLGPASADFVNKKIRLIRFTFFDELAKIFSKELSSRKYDVVIHSAAVSDYRPRKPFGHKISSEKKRLKLDLVPTPKLVDLIKRLSPASLAVAFKFEPEAGTAELINKARALLRRSNMDLAVANNADAGAYQAFIIDQFGIVGSVIKNKAELANKLTRVVNRYLTPKHRT